jgi:hypothetical protein
MKILHAIAMAGAAVGLSGCATVINGTSQKYQIRSDPEGALATLSNGQTCTTPCELSLKRRHDLRIDFERDGYEPAYVLVQSRTGGALAGNLLLGGLVGGLVDSSNGASNHLHPRPLHLRMVPVGSGSEAELLGDEGEVTATVAAHNAELADDLRESMGDRAVGGGAAVGPERDAEPADGAIDEPADEVVVAGEDGSGEG